MIKPAKVLLYYLSLLVLLTNCDTKEEYYARPDTLADPIYQQLQQRGNYKSFLALVDKANYKNTLSAAGYWTLFAPNDEAFAHYFQENGLGGVDDIDAATAQKIVTYALVFNAFTTERLPDYQANTGWVKHNAFKRRTAYYDGVYTANEIKVGGQVLSQQHVISSNRNVNLYVEGDNNNKYIPYFMNAYFTNRQLTAADYNYFYPNVPYTGFNVADARVVEPNIIAENGVIHGIDRVIMPLLNIEQYLASRPEYSEFKGLYEKYMVAYGANEGVTRRYQVVTGSSSPVYVKFYDPLLTFAPNNENFEKMTDNDGQSDGWSLFVPTNDQLKHYLSTVILEHYKSLDNLPLNIIRDFLNAHMFPTTVWPSKFRTTSNNFGEEARFDPASNVVDKKVLSNGMFYGTNQVQQANVFHSVYGKAYLDPKYSMMIRALEGDLKLTVINPAVKFTMFLISDEALTKAGFSWDSRFNYWVYTPPAGGATVSGGQASIRLNRIINQHLAFTFQNELSNLNGSGIVETLGGEYIKYENGQVWAAGNADLGERVKVTGPVQTNNGVVYYTDRILNFSEKKVSEHLAENPEFSSFYQYLVNSSLSYDAASLDIKGITPGTPYTLFIPTNAAIQQAVNDGVLPGTGEAPNKVPNFTPGSADEQNLVASFIQYHILANEMIVPDGVKEGGYETIFKNIDGETGTLAVENAPNVIKVTDSHYRTANVVNTNSNVLSNRAIIHQIDNYLLYR